MKGYRFPKSNDDQHNDILTLMKTCILSLAAVAAFAGSALAERALGEQGDLRLKMRTHPTGQAYFVYVREPQPVVTVALYRGGREVSRYQTRVTEKERLRLRENQHGQTTVVYTQDR